MKIKGEIMNKQFVLFHFFLFLNFIFYRLDNGKLIFTVNQYFNN